MSNTNRVTLKGKVTEDRATDCYRSTIVVNTDHGTLEGIKPIHKIDGDFAKRATVGDVIEFTARVKGHRFLSPSICKIINDKSFVTETAREGYRTARQLFVNYNKAMLKLKDGFFNDPALLNELLDHTQLFINQYKIEMSYFREW